MINDWRLVGIGHRHDGERELAHAIAQRHRKHRRTRHGGHDMTDKQLYRVPEAMILLSLSRSVIYELIRSGRLHSVREGRARRIPAAAITDYITLLAREAEAGGGYGKSA